MNERINVYLNIQITLNALSIVYKNIKITKYTKRI